MSDVEEKPSAASDANADERAEAAEVKEVQRSATDEAATSGQEQAEQPEEDDTEEEEGDDDSEEDAVVHQLTQQVALLGSSGESDEEESGNSVAGRRSASVSGADPYFSRLDDETVLKIFSFLNLEDLVTASEVSCKWNLLAKYDSLWQSMYESANWQHPFPSPPSGLNWYELFVMRVKNEIECVMAGQGLEEEEEDEMELVEDAEEFGKKFLIDFAQPYFTPNHKSEVDLLLDRGEFAMEELLDSDAFVTDLRSGKERLLAHLTQSSSIKELLRVAFAEPPEETNGTPEGNKILQLAHIAFQTLASNPLAERFIANSELLDCLFSYMDSGGGVVSPTKSGYFAKITEVLFEKYPTELVMYFRTRDEITGYFVRNAHDNFLMELLFKLVDSGITHQWLHDANLIPQLVHLLNVDSSVEVQENATQVLVNVFTLCQPWTQSVLVIDIFNNEEVAENLVAYVRSAPVSGFKIKQGLSVLISVLNLITEDLVDVPALIIHVMDSLDFFAGILRDPLLLGDMQSIATTVQFLDPPFGSVRLGILELFVALLYTGYPVVVAEMEQHEIFTILLELFFKYKWNNIVHHQITQIFSGLLCGNDDDMMRAVLEKCGLVEGIVNAYEKGEHVGYMGHLRQIANELLKVTKYSAPVALLLEANDRWMSFALGQLQDINEVEDTPLGRVGTRSMTDDDDYYDVDMDGYEYQDYDDNQDNYAYEMNSDEDEYEDYDVVNDYSTSGAYTAQYEESEESEEDSGSEGSESDE